MRKVTLVFFVLVFISGIFAEKLPRVDVHKINEQFTKFSIYWPGFYVNALAFDGPDGLILVDTGIEDTGKELKKKILEIYKKKPKYIINTHEHVDHTGANNIFGLEPIIISHKTMRKTMVEDFILNEYGPEFIPDICFDKELVLHLNGEEIILKSFTGSHTDCDIIVHFKKANIIATGDLVYKNGFPSFSAYAGDVFKYDKILEKLVNYCPKDILLINGHTNDSNYNDLVDYKNMLFNTLKITKEAFKNNKSLKDLKNEGIIQKWKNWKKEGYVNAEDWFRDNLDVLKNSGPRKIDITKFLYKELKDNGIEGFLKKYIRFKNKSDEKKYDISYNIFAGFGYYFEKKGKYREAEKIYLYGLKEYPKEKYAYAYLSGLYEKQKKIKSAKKIIKKMLNVFPKNKWAKKKLKKLETK